MPTAIVFCNRCGHASAEDAQFCQRCGTSLTISPAAAVQTALPSRVPHFGGFWIRVVAAFLDFLFLFGVLIPVRMLLGSVATAIGMNANISIHGTLVAWRIVRISISVVLVFIYRTMMESSELQATLGKIAVRLKVTDLRGERISFSRAVGRYFAKLLSLSSLGLGYLMAAFDEEKQALHDRVAGTFVVYRNEGR